MLHKTPPLGSVKKRIVVTLAIGLGLCVVAAAVAYWPGQKRGEEAATTLPAPVTLVAQSGPLPAQGKEAAEEPVAPPADSNPSELELLNRIRQQIGSPLDSSVFQAPVADVAGDDGPSGRFDAAYAREVESDETGRERAIFNRPGHPQAPPANPQTTYRQALRDAARVLDEGAAHLEDADAFNQADELRDRASVLRNLARQSVVGTDK